MVENTDSTVTLLEAITTYVVPTATFLLSLIASVYAILEFNKTKASIKISVGSDSLDEYIVDRESEDVPDVYWQSDYRLFPKIIISNKSNQPISIHSFELNNGSKFDIDTKHGDNYVVTLSTNKEKLDSGLTAYSDKPNESINFPFGNSGKFLKPVITLKPYESISGYLFFRYDDPIDGKIKLTVKTSRKDFSARLKVSRLLKSLNPHKFQKPLLDKRYKEVI